MASASRIDGTSSTRFTGGIAVKCVLAGLAIALLGVGAAHYLDHTLRGQLGGMSEELAGRQPEQAPSPTAAAEVAAPESARVETQARRPPGGTLGGALQSLQRRSETDRILESLASAAAAFNAPRVMGLHETRQIRFLLGPGVPPEVLGERLVVRDGEVIRTTTIRFNERVEATLTGAGFDVRPVTREIQGVSSRDITAWIWEVTATDSGVHTLHLTVSVLFNADGSDVGTSIRSFAEEIRVEVTAWQMVRGFVAEEWQWLWSAILVPLAGWLWVRRRGRIAGVAADAAMI